MPRLCEKCGSQIPAINTGPTPTDPTLFYSCQNCGHSVRGIIDCLGPPPEKSVKMYARFNGVVTKEEIFQLHKLFPYLQTASVVDLYKLASTERSLYLGEAGESMFEELKAKTLKQNLSINGVSVDGTC